MWFLEQMEVSTGDFEYWQNHNVRDTPFVLLLGATLNCPPRLGRQLRVPVSEPGGSLGACGSDSWLGPTQVGKRGNFRGATKLGFLVEDGSGEKGHC